MASQEQLTGRCVRSESREGMSLSEDLPLHQLMALPAGAQQRLQEEMVAENRMRMIGGMKRYFHRKRNEGLLSSQGLRTLVHACDTCTDRPHLPINIFGRLDVRASFPTSAALSLGTPRQTNATRICGPLLRSSGTSFSG
jgi:hypothetical protein